MTFIHTKCATIKHASPKTARDIQHRAWPYSVGLHVFVCLNLHVCMHAPTDKRDRERKETDRDRWTQRGATFWAAIKATKTKQSAIETERKKKCLADQHWETTCN